LDRSLDPDFIKALYTFPEVRENWLGFSADGNKGRGLGPKFANALHNNLHVLFQNFGNERQTEGSHLEKLCLIEQGVGRDNISDFTTNLIKEYLLDFTETFTKQHIRRGLRKRFPVPRVRFNFETETWQSRAYTLPCHEGEFVLLTPRNMLTKDDNWISREDLLKDFDMVREAVPNGQLRSLINNYFEKVLPENAGAAEAHEAKIKTIRQFPQLIDAYIVYKEEHGAEAVSTSSGKVKTSEQLYQEQFGKLALMLREHTGFYDVPGRTYWEALKRVHFLKDVIENKGGHKLFYINGKSIQREPDVHILYRLTWFATPSDVSREVNDGRGPADFKISRGSKDKSLVEFKLASNPQLERNLAHQSEIYEKASDALRSIKVIVYFTKAEYESCNHPQEAQTRR